MNYARIYEQFIADRLGKQPENPVYFERHHILPRCLGGGDEKENLIRLSPEDHLFAHLLLAKIHGGKLWSAVFLMTANSPRNKRRVNKKLRSSYGLAKRSWSEHARTLEGKKGAENGNHNATVYKWIHLDSGKRDLGTLYDMWIKYGGSRPIWTSASVRSSGKPSALGWAIDDGFLRKRSKKGQSFDFVNKDGRLFHGTQSEFCKKFGLSVASASRVVKKESVTVCGWRLSTTKIRDHFDRKSSGNPPREGAGKIYYIEREGELFSGPRHKVAKIIGSTAGQFSAGAGHIRRGAASTYKGWKIQWQEALF